MPLPDDVTTTQRPDAASNGAVIDRAAREGRQTVDQPIIGRFLDSRAIASLSGDRSRQVRPDPVALGTLAEMRTDPTLAAGLRLMSAPILAHVRKVQVLCDDPKIKRFVEYALLESGVLYQTVRSSLSSLWAGVAVHEKVWQAEDLVLTITRPDALTGEPAEEVAWQGPAHTYDKIALVNPVTVPAILRTDDGRFNGFVQTQADGEKEIPPAQAYVYTHDPEFGNFWGRPRIRDAHAPWLWKQQVIKWWMAWAERKVSPPRVGRFPLGKDRFGTSNAETIVRVINALDSITGVALPSTRQQTGTGRGSVNFEWDIQELSTTDRTEVFISTLDRLCQEMLDAIGVPKRAFQEGQFGTKAEAEAHSDLFLLQTDAELFSQVTNAESYLVKPLVIANFGDRAFAKTPVTLAVAGLTEDERQVLHELLMALAANPNNQAVFDLRALAERFNAPTSEEREQAAATQDTETPATGDIGGQNGAGPQPAPEEPGQAAPPAAGPAPNLALSEDEELALLERFVDDYETIALAAAFDPNKWDVSEDANSPLGYKIINRQTGHRLGGAFASQVVKAYLAYAKKQGKDAKGKAGKSPEQLQKEAEAEARQQQRDAEREQDRADRKARQQRQDTEHEADRTARQQRQQQQDARQQQRDVERRQQAAASKQASAERQQAAAQRQEQTTAQHEQQQALAKATAQRDALQNAVKDLTGEQAAKAAERDGWTATTGSTDRNSATDMAAQQAKADPLNMYSVLPTKGGFLVIKKPVTDLRPAAQNVVASDTALADEPDDNAPTERTRALWAVAHAALTALFRRRHESDAEEPEPAEVDG